MRTPRRSARGNALSGTVLLGRLVLRRDRVRLPTWLVVLGGLIAVSAAAVPPIYDTPQKVAGYAATVGASPVSFLMSGRQAGIDTLGGIVANEISQVAQLGICLMVIFLVVRHTRAEEESGRAELVRSGVVGRHAAALAALVYAMVAALLIGIITSASMISADLDPAGSIVYGAGLTLLGLTYAAVALVAVQLSTSARGALAVSGTALGLGYLLRGIGAMQDNVLVWLSPFGWAQQMEAFGAERWWPASLLVAATTVLLGVAARLTAHRDFGGGLLNARPGQVRGSRPLGTPTGLLLRLQRGLLLGWGIGLLALGALYGAVVPTIPGLVASNREIAAAFGADPAAEAALVDAFVAYIFVFMAVVSSCCAVASVLRLRAEEESGLTEMVLATAVRRRQWLGAAAAVAAAGTVGLAVLMGTGLAVGYGAASGDWSRTGSLVAGQLSYVPAVLVVAAAAVALHGVAPRLATLAWALVGLVFVQLVLGETMQLPDWLQAVSPFWHLPPVPTESFRPTPGLVETAVALALTGAGLLAHGRRDVAPG